VVFGNLISNAIKYTNPGGQIHISLVYDEQQSAAVFTISDTGIGISADELTPIFEPFYRAQHEARCNALLPHSSGLGLPHVKEMLAQHDGDIRVSSEVGKGSRFCVTLPSLSPPESVQELNHEDAHDDAGHERATVLIVEDNAGLNDYLKAVLGAHYHCLSALNGVDAEALAYEHLPDLIVTDIRLPERSGLELAQRLKNDVRSSHIPIIVVTAVADAATKLSALTLQVDDVIAKPFDVPELKLKIRNLIQRTRAHHAARGSDRADHTAANVPAATWSALDQRFMTQFTHVISAHLANADIELDDISRLLHLSKKQLQRKIKALTGLSPMEYLRHHRIAQACTLLQQGRTITDVCYSVGFSSQSYFSTCFKQQLGDTPRNWQQRHLASPVGQTQS
jgi:DNA-binding response OmpR family regulator